MIVISRAQGLESFEKLAHCEYRNGLWAHREREPWTADEDAREANCLFLSAGQASPPRQSHVIANETCDEVFDTGKTGAANTSSSVASGLPSAMLSRNCREEIGILEHKTMPDRRSQGHIGVRLLRRRECVLCGS